jgi:hypothetical protein
MRLVLISLILAHAFIALHLTTPNPAAKRAPLQAVPQACKCTQ